MHQMYQGGSGKSSRCDITFAPVCTGFVPATAPYPFALCTRCTTPIYIKKYIVIYKGGYMGGKGIYYARAHATPGAEDRRGGIL